MGPLDLDQAREALIAAGITGPHRSHERQGSIEKIHKLVAGDEETTFGLSGCDRYSAAEILAFMSELVGCPADITDVACEDLIDPEATIRGLIAAGDRLSREADRGSILLAATGHPTGMLHLYIRIVEAYRLAGGKVVHLREEEDLGIGKRGRHTEVRYIGGVGCLADWGNLRHTHHPAPMEALLEDEPWPDIVLADHGFAGAAIERGIPAIAVMDINDQALAIPWAEHKDVIVIPMDDNRPPRLYEPAWRIVEERTRGTS